MFPWLGMELEEGSGTGDVLEPQVRERPVWVENIAVADGVSELEQAYDRALTDLIGQSVVTHQTYLIGEIGGIYFSVLCELGPQSRSGSHPHDDDLTGRETDQCLTGTSVPITKC